MRLRKGVIFDLDGVLVDSETHWRQVESEFLKGLVPSWGSQDQAQILGMSGVDVHKLLCDKYGLKLSRQDFFAFYQGLAKQIYGHRVSPVPGAIELLQALQQAKFILGLASSSPLAWMEIVVRRFNLENFFSTVASSDHVEGRGKPAPDIYVYATSQLGLVPSDCIAIEDSGKGIESAIRAGLSCIGLKHKLNQREELNSAHLVVESLLALDLSMVEGLCEVKRTTSAAPEI